MLDLAEQLVDAGHAYVSDSGNVYYAVASFPDYGPLSGNTLDALRAGHRGEVEPDKRDAGRLRALEGRRRGPPAEMADAALGRGLSRAGTSSARRWRSSTSGRGSTSTPAASTTCSRTTRTRSPSRRRSSADRRPASGSTGSSSRSAARRWRSRPATSSGSPTSPSAASTRSRSATSALTSRYRHKLEYTTESLAAAAAGLESLRERLRALGEPPADGPWAAPPPLRAGAAPDRPIGTAEGVAGHGGGDAVPLTDRAHAPTAPLSPEGRALHDRFVDAIDDDLDLPTALAVVREAVRAPIADDERRWLALDADFVLGLDLDRTWSTPRESSRRNGTRRGPRAARGADGGAHGQGLRPGR